MSLGAYKKPLKFRALILGHGVETAGFTTLAAAVLGLIIAGGGGKAITYLYRFIDIFHVFISKSLALGFGEVVILHSLAELLPPLLKFVGIQFTDLV